jgi:hypothetical protein
MPSIGKANLETVIIHGGGEVVNTFRWGLEQHSAARELCEAGARGAR